MHNCGLMRVEIKFPSDLTSGGRSSTFLLGPGWRGNALAAA